MSNATSHVSFYYTHAQITIIDGVWSGDWSMISHFLTLYTVMEQPLVLSTMPLSSYQMNYPTLQFGCYETALYLIFYNLSLFGLVDIIIRFDSCLALLHTADSMPSHYFILFTLKPYPYSAKLYSYSAISLYVLSFTPYLLIFLSLTHLIAGSYPIGGYLDYILLDDKPGLV